MPSIPIYAVERGRAPADLPRSGDILDVASFDLVTPPPVPLQLGQRIHIYTLAVRRGTRRNVPNLPQPPRYASDDAGVTGRIAAIRLMELATTEFLIVNETLHSLIEHAYLTVPHIEGLTVRLDLGRWIARTLRLPILPYTRRIRLEHNADISPREGILEGRGTPRLADEAGTDEENE